MGRERQMWQRPYYVVEADRVTGRSKYLDPHWRSSRTLSRPPGPLSASTSRLDFWRFLANMPRMASLSGVPI